MTRDKPVSRRKVLRAAGIATSTAVVAGCGTPESGPSDNESGGEEDANGTDEDTGGADNETGGADNETGGADNETGGADNETGGADDTEWRDVEEIVLDGHTEAWRGIEPAPIEGEDNPTLVLFAGQEYAITWENADGAAHNIAMWDENEEALESTEIMDQEGETQTLEFEATEEMVAYICEVHPNTMVGDLEIRTDDGGGAGSNNETDGENNETDGENNETDE